MIGKLLATVVLYYIEQLNHALKNSSQFKEICIDGPNGQSLCALINGKIGWLMYLRYNGDAGYSTRNPEETSDAALDFRLSNGQLDTYPRNWTYPVSAIKQALTSFIENGNLPDEVNWHADF